MRPICMRLIYLPALYNMSFGAKTVLWSYFNVRIFIFLNTVNVSYHQNTNFGLFMDYGPKMEKKWDLFSATKVHTLMIQN